MTKPTITAARISSAPRILQSGSISGRNGMRDALEAAAQSCSIRDQIVRVIANDLSGLIGILYGRYITGARIRDGEHTSEGHLAVKQLLALQSGSYDLLLIEKEVLIQKLKQSLGIDLQALLLSAELHFDKDLADLVDQATPAALVGDYASPGVFENEFGEGLIRPSTDESVLKMGLSLARELFPQPPEPDALSANVGFPGNNERTELQRDAIYQCDLSHLDSELNRLAFQLSKEEGGDNLLAWAWYSDLSQQSEQDRQDKTALQLEVKSEELDLLKNPDLAKTYPKLTRVISKRKKASTGVIESSVTNAPLAGEYADIASATTASATTQIDSQLRLPAGDDSASQPETLRRPADIERATTQVGIESGAIGDDSALLPEALRRPADIKSETTQTGRQRDRSIGEDASSPEALSRQLEENDVVIDIGGTIYDATVPPAKTFVESVPVETSSSSSSCTSEACDVNLPPVNYVLIPDDEFTSCLDGEISALSCEDFMAIDSESGCGETRDSVCHYGYSESLYKSWDKESLDAIITSPGKQSQKLVVLQDLEATLTRVRTGESTGQFRTITTERLKVKRRRVAPPPGPSRNRRVETPVPEAPTVFTTPVNGWKEGAEDSADVEQASTPAAAPLPSGKFKETSQVYLEQVHKQSNVHQRKFIETGKSDRFSGRRYPLNPIACAVAVVVVLCFGFGVRMITGVNDSLTAAESALRSGNVTDAIKLYSRVIEREPKNVAGYVGRAAAETSVDPPGAIIDYRRALELQPDLLSARAKLSTVLLREGRNADALSQARLVLEKAPGDPDAHRVCGICLAKLGNFAEAIPSLEIALKTNTGPKAETCFHLYQACMQCNRKQDAADYINEAVTAAPANCDYLVERARLRMGEADYSTASKDLESAIAIAPFAAVPRYLLGVCNYEQSRVRHAISDWTDALNRGYADADVYYRRGRAYLQTGQYHEALADLDRYLQTFPYSRDARWRRNIARAQVRRNMPVVVAEEPRQHVSNVRQYDAANDVGAGYNALQAKDTTSAVSILSKAVKSNPDDPQARKFLAYAHLRSGDMDNAARQFQAWSYLQPVPVSEMWIFGKKMMTAGKYGPAASVFAELVKAEPTNSAARILLIKSCALSGENQRAQTLCREAMASARDQSEYQRYRVLMP